MALDVILTTMTGRRNQTMRSLQALPKSLELRIITVRDVHNASRARNIGVSLTTAPIIAVLDDDIEFTPENFMYLLSRVKKHRCVWSISCQFMAREDYVNVGGYDERFLQVYQEDMDFVHRLHTQGVKVEFHFDRVKHFGGGFTYKKNMLIHFNLPPICFRYNPKRFFRELFRGFRCLNPLRFATNLALIHGAVYYPLRLAVGRRSKFEQVKEKP